MAKNKDEKDVLVVRDEKTGEISVVAGLNADGTPKPVSYTHLHADAGVPPAQRGLRETGGGRHEGKRHAAEVPHLSLIHICTPYMSPVCLPAWPLLRE